MFAQTLQKYLPENALPYLQKWFGGYNVHLRLTRERQSKLGDYCKKKNGSHAISVNVTLSPSLFFFVLTHELAHLIAFETYGRGIAPHGKEWKQIYKEMLLESVCIYETDLQPIILKYARSPKANFMASSDLVRYFIKGEDSVFVEDLPVKAQFIYRRNVYVIEQKLRKNYLCIQLKTGRRFTFSPLAKVEHCKD